MRCAREHPRHPCRRPRHSEPDYDEVRVDACSRRSAELNRPFKRRAASSLEVGLGAIDDGLPNVVAPTVHLLLPNPTLAALGSVAIENEILEGDNFAINATTGTMTVFIDRLTTIIAAIQDILGLLPVDLGRLNAVLLMYHAPLLAHRLVVCLCLYLPPLG